MRILCTITFVLVVFFTNQSLAGDIQEIELTDGSLITGEVVSMDRGIYTIKTKSLGILKIQSSQIAAIHSQDSRRRDGSSGGGTNPAQSQIKSLESMMMGDQEIMNKIMAMSNDPAFLKVLEDPTIMNAVNAGDISTLLKNPQFLELLNNKRIRNISKKVQQE